LTYQSFTMRVVNFSSKKLLLSYLTVCIIGIVFLLTGYSFTIDILDYTIIGIIILYPIGRFFLSRISIKIKVITALAAIIGICFIAWKVMVFIAFSTAGEKRKVQEWNVDGYRIVLTKRLDWAGPPYYRYDLSRTRVFGLITKTLAYSYPGTELTDSCTIHFKEDFDYGESLFEFDKCSGNIRKLE
jgi:hypothetical protein